MLHTCLQQAGTGGIEGRPKQRAGGRGRGSMGRGEGSMMRGGDGQDAINKGVHERPQNGMMPCGPDTCLLLHTVLVTDMLLAR